MNRTNQSSRPQSDETSIYNQYVDINDEQNQLTRDMTSNNKDPSKDSSTFSINDTSSLYYNRPDSGTFLDHELEQFLQSAPFGESQYAEFYPENTFNTSSCKYNKPNYSLYSSFEQTQDLLISQQYSTYFTLLSH